MRPNTKPKKVHFHFEPHRAWDKFMQRPTGHRPKNFFYEEALGRKGFDKNELAAILEHGDFHHHQMAKRILNLQKQGSKTSVGEYRWSLLPNRVYLAGINQMLERTSFMEHPSLDTYKRYAEAMVSWGKIRHKKIRKNLISASKKGSVEAVYGTTHSLLSAELRKKGIESSRSIKPTIFSWSNMCLRKMQAGKTPTEMEYLRGAVSELIGTTPIWDKLGVMSTGRDGQRYVLLENALLMRLSKDQLKFALNSPELIFTLNGLPKPQYLEGKQFWLSARKFMEKHSSAYQRMRLKRK